MRVARAVRIVADRNSATDSSRPAKNLADTRREVETDGFFTLERFPIADESREPGNKIFAADLARVGRKSSGTKIN